MRRTVFATLLTLLLVFARSSSADVPTPGVQPTIEDAVRTLDVHSILNARDLGGLKGKNGFIPHGHFYRTATLAYATQADRDMLHTRGVKLDIDLRTWVESDVKRDVLARDPRFTYRRMSLLDSGASEWFRGLHGIYLHALDAHQPNFRDIFHAMATYDGGGAILYHCTSGKDRTGMVTAILLDLAGVARDAIVRDYAISAHYLGRDASASPPSFISDFLDALHSRYGGAHAFLAHCGLSERDIHALLMKLGQA
jgi:protein-tyrosine phosphatase